MASLRASALIPALALALTCGSTAALLARPAGAQAFVGWRADYPPPPLPVYLQPPLPGPDYVWAPGYWGWDDDVEDYYWVPGTWVLAPEPGLLWTPGYWGWSDGAYLFHQGYWGQSVGWYGGVDYGFGYTGRGFAGGYWRGPHYVYNRSVNNVGDVHITNVYNQRVDGGGRANPVSYNGGPGGVTAVPTAQQLAAERTRHVEATPLQAQHLRYAQDNRLSYASANHGAPPIAATARPAAFMGAGVAAAAHAVAPTPARPAYGDPREPQAMRPPPPAYAARPQPTAPNPYAGASGPRAAGARPPPSRVAPPRAPPPHPGARPDDRR